MPLKPEQIDHINLVNWFDFQFPELSEDFHHFANERRCSVQQGRTLKRMGVKKGVADFFLAISMNERHGAWFELKVGKNKPTKEQTDFLSRKFTRGYDVYLVWGIDEAKRAILNYLKDYKSNRQMNEPKNLCNN